MCFYLALLAIIFETINDAQNIPTSIAYKSVFFKLNGASNHELFDLADGLGGVQTLRAHVHAIHDGVAAEQAVWVFQIVQSLIGGLIATVGDEAIGLQEACGADEFVGIPPEAGAAG